MAKRIGTVRDSDPGFKKFKRQLKGGPDAVNIGLFGEQGSDLVIYAASNEFGTEKNPERSFLRSTVDEKKQTFKKFIDRNKMFERDLKGKIDDFYAAMNWGKLLENNTVNKFFSFGK